MRSVAAGAVVATTAMLCLGVADARADTFRFRICNNSNVTAAVAVSNHVSDNDNRFVVQGWWIVGSGNCEWLGYFPKGWFYYYAEERGNQRIVWQGNEVRLCVRHPGPWERVNTDGYNCRSDEALAGFTGEFIDSGTGTFTVNLN
jgi:uncharacterized membrane protein